LEAEVMANERPSEYQITSTLDSELSDSLSRAARMAEQSQSVIERLRAALDDTSRVAAELAEVTAAFEAVAEELVVATLGASENVTRGDLSHERLVGLVERLGDLARRSVLAGFNGRQHVRGYEKAAATATTAADEAEVASGMLSLLLKDLSEQAAAIAAIPTIEVVVAQPPARESSASTLSTSLTLTGRDADPSKRGRYRN
jgi:hypothetical protein